jgi:hypothetical protein
MLRVLCLTIVFFVIGCSSIQPNLIKKINEYQYRNLDLNFYESISLIHTYSVESLEIAYDKLFCTDLANCQNNIDNIKNNPLFSGFDLSKKPIVNNNLGIKEVNLYRIIYYTKGQDNLEESVSGGIYYPNTNKIKGVILFFHPTFFSKSSVSTYDINNSVNKSVAAIFAANGYIVLYPDYIGMGKNRNKVHPYVLYPQVNAIDGLSILQASQNFISHKININIKDKIPLYITGYSEGSSYVLWFSRLYQEKKDFFDKFNKTHYTLKKVVPISGAYNLSEVTWNYLFSNNNTFNSSTYKISNSLITSLLKPPLLSLALLSYGYYGESANYEKVFNLDFFNMNCSFGFISNCKINESNLNLSQLLLLESSVVTNLPSSDNAFEIYLVGKINNSANYTINNGIYTIFTNNIKPLVNKNLINNSKLLSLLQEGDIYYWHSEVPTVLITLKRDSVVSPLNTNYAYVGMLENNSRNLQQIIVDNDKINNKLIGLMPSMEVDHTNGFTYLFILALKQFDN